MLKPGPGLGRGLGPGPDPGMGPVQGPGLGMGLGPGLALRVLEPAVKQISLSRDHVREYVTIGGGAG